MNFNTPPTTFPIVHEMKLWEIKEICPLNIVIQNGFLTHGISLVNMAKYGRHDSIYGGIYIIRMRLDGNTKPSMHSLTQNIVNFYEDLVQTLV